VPLIARSWALWPLTTVLGQLLVVDIPARKIRVPFTFIKLCRYSSSLLRIAPSTTDDDLSTKPTVTILQKWGSTSCKGKVQEIAPTLMLKSNVIGYFQLVIQT